jgi:hypothetical protein
MKWRRIMKRTLGLSIESLLEHPNVRRTERDGRTLYVAADIVAALVDSAHPADYWDDLKHLEPALARWVETVEFHDGDLAVALDAVDLDGVLRMIQSIPSPRAERLKWWLAESGRRRLEESEDPEMAFLRTRRLYEHRGYPRRWVDKRIGVVNSRHELTAEWYKRGVRESDDFRALTNALMTGAFGMDVIAYRQFKGLDRPTQALRDHMTDLELALTALAETTAVALGRSRGSQGVEQLVGDARDAGEIAGRTLAEIERRSGRPVKSAAPRGLDPVRPPVPAASPDPAQAA